MTTSEKADAVRETIARWRSAPYFIDPKAAGEDFRKLLDLLEQAVILISTQVSLSPVDERWIDRAYEALCGGKT